MDPAADATETFRKVIPWHTGSGMSFRCLFVFFRRGLPVSKSREGRGWVPGALEYSSAGFLGFCGEELEEFDDFAFGEGLEKARGHEALGEGFARLDLAGGDGD